MSVKHARLLEKQAKLVSCYWFRCLFGNKEYEKQGHFVESQMSVIVGKYYLRYPEGNHELEGHLEDVECAVISDDGTVLYTHSDDMMLIMWDLTTMKQIKTEQKEMLYHKLRFHFPFVIGVGWDTVIYICDSDSMRTVHLLREHTDFVMEALYYHRLDCLITGSKDSTIRMWNMDKGECFRVMSIESGWITGLALAGDRLLSISNPSKIREWDLHEFSVIREIDCESRRFKVNRDATLMVSPILFKNSWRVYEWPSMEEMANISCSERCSLFHPWHHQLFIVGRSYKSVFYLSFYNAKKGWFIDEWEAHTEDITDLCITPDGTRLVSVSRDKLVKVWDISDLISN